MVPTEVLLIEITKREHRWMMQYHPIEGYMMSLPAKDNEKASVHFHHRHFGALIREVWTYWFGELPCE